MCSITVERLGELAGALARLAGESLDDAPDAVLAESLVGLREVIDALEAQWLRRLEVFDRRGGAAAAGAVSTGAWVRHQCRLAPGAARDRVELARALAERPETAAALAAGEISVPHARLVTVALAELAEAASRELAAEAEPALVDVARGMDPGRLRRELVHVRHALAPEAAATAADRTFDRRGLSVSETFGGMVAVDGMLDAEGGAALLSALMALAGPTGPEDRRTSRQRRTDALVDLARRQLDRGDLPALGTERPHLTVTVPLATLRRQPGSPAADTGWVGPVCGETARRIACDAGLSRVITDGPSQPLDVGRRTRTVPPALRTALAVRDRGCVFPGCDRPPPFTDAHHLVAWVDGGPTSLANLALLCRIHHRTVHEGRWQLTRGPDGQWTAIPPGRASPPAPLAA